MAEITIENYKRLAPTYGDHVIFLLNGKKFDYEVCSTHLSSRTPGIPNDEIFEELHLDKIAFCNIAYGYSPVGDGIFPPYKTDDIGAAKRVINDLFYRIERTLPEQVITIDNYKSIPYIKRGDKVQFNVDGEIINYKVQGCYQEACYYNALIFNKLHLDKYSFCTNAYGYETNSGEFPNSRNYDFEALHRVINALFDHICTTRVSADVKPKVKSNLTEFNTESIKAPSLTTTFKITL